MATVRVLHPKLMEDYYAAEEDSVEQHAAREKIIDVFTEGTDLDIGISGEHFLYYKVLPDGSQELSMASPDLLIITKEVQYGHRK